MKRTAVLLTVAALTPAVAVAAPAQPGGGPPSPPPAAIPVDAFNPAKYRNTTAAEVAYLKQMHGWAKRLEAARKSALRCKVGTRCLDSRVRVYADAGRDAAGVVRLTLRLGQVEAVCIRRTGRSYAQAAAAVADLRTALFPLDGDRLQRLIVRYQRAWGTTRSAAVTCRELPAVGIRGPVEGMV